MLRDLLDSLRCPNAHAESWLVAMVHDAVGPRLLRADLACPICAAEFALVDGVLDIGAPVLSGLAAELLAPEPLRLAALLGVAEGALPVMLSGRYCAAGSALAELCAVPQLWVNAPASVESVATCSRLNVGERLPLGVATLAAAAIDAAYATPDMLESVARAVKQGGRIVAPVSIPIPPTLRELVRDDAEWVAEVTTRASGLIELRRRASHELP